MDRKKVWMRWVVWGVLIALLAGCGGTAATTEAPAAAEVPAESEPTPMSEPSQVVIVIPEDPPSFNAMISDTGYDALVMELVLLGLTDLDANGNIITELAASLPTLENGDVVMDEEKPGPWTSPGGCARMWSGRMAKRSPPMM